MRKILLGLATLLLVTGAAWAQSATQQQSLADAARKARAERAQKDLSKVPMYTNDDIPQAGAAVSVMGATQAAPAPAAAGESAAGGAAPAQGAAAAGQAPAAGQEECDEQCWRQKFSEKRAAIKDAERELDILQREFNLSRVQYYQDPNQAVREQYSANTAGGKELQDLQNQINDKRQEEERLKQELSSLEDDLRRAGGDPGWAREQ